MAGNAHKDQDMASAASSNASSMASDLHVMPESARLAAEAAVQRGKAEQSCKLKNELVEEKLAKANELVRSADAAAKRHSEAAEQRHQAAAAKVEKAKATIIATVTAGGFDAVGTLIEQIKADIATATQEAQRDKAEAKRMGEDAKEKREVASALERRVGSADRDAADSMAQAVRLDTAASAARTAEAADMAAKRAADLEASAREAEVKAASARRDGLMHASIDGDSAAALVAAIHQVTSDLSAADKLAAADKAAKACAKELAAANAAAATAREEVNGLIVEASKAQAAAGAAAASGDETAADTYTKRSINLNKSKAAAETRAREAAAAAETAAAAAARATEEAKPPMLKAAELAAAAATANLNRLKAQIAAFQVAGNMEQAVTLFDPRDVALKEVAAAELSRQKEAAGAAGAPSAGDLAALKSKLEQS